MRKFASTMVGFALVLGANGALAQAFGAKGTPAISADRLFGFSLTGMSLDYPAPVGEVEADASHFGLAWQGANGTTNFPLVYDVPRLAFDYFIIDSLSIGGSIGYASLSVEEEDNDEIDGNAFIFAPRAGYVWNFNDWASFWIRGGFTYHSWSAGDDIEENALALTVEPTFVLAPTDNWGFVLGPTLDLTFTGERELGNQDVDVSYTSIGIIRAGMIGWF
jgi:hypothetical protein